MVATSRIQPSEKGMSTFQPSFISWSYRTRGSEPRSQMKKKMNIHIFTRNHRTGHQPSLAPAQTVVIGGGARQPPRNRVVASADSVARLMYSARKNIANFSEEYSVWKPPTSSPSASGRSNGARLVSPTPETAYSRKENGNAMMYQRPCCALTICDVDIDPA